MPTGCHQVTLKLPATAGHEYDIVVRPGLLSDVGQALHERGHAGSVILVSDSHVFPLHGQALQKHLESQHFRVIRAVIDAGENNKNLSHIGRLYDAILPAGIDRRTPLLALGGGVVGDMGGFVAATLLRGIPFYQIPTSLLAMVDASVGGKTGFDHPVGKNLIGAFHQPSAVWIDPATLTTLPEAELRGGLAECIKHDLIRDATHFAQLERIIPAALARDLAALVDLVAHNIAIKARVVEADPLEKGQRAHLNMGHTFAHAIERVSNYAVAHGPAVALGMAAAAHVACQMEFMNQNERKSLLNILRLAGLPTAMNGLSVDAIMACMIHDKKVQSGKIRFVLPQGIGAAQIRDDVQPQWVRAALESLHQ